MIQLLIPITAETKNLSVESKEQKLASAVDTVKSVYK